MNSTEIHPQHSSMLGRRRMPSGFGEQICTADQRELLERLALEIFASMVNNGQTFQAALAAVYFSGIQHAAEIGCTSPGPVTTHSEER